MARRLLCLLAACSAALVLIGCHTSRRECVPPVLTRHGSFVNLDGCPGEYRTVPAEVVQALTSGPDGPGGAGNPGAANGTSGCSPVRRLNILCLSGGGMFGAYPAGFLAGWTQTGTRPAFDIVTGISTGSLIATFAFLGPAYDDRPLRLFANATSRDIYRRRCLLRIPLSDAAASSEPLEKLIAANIDGGILAEVARAHACGRRLFVGTTNLDTFQMTVWDMGAIAASGRPDALCLYRRILLASCSVPGFLPPVAIDVNVNGRRYTELHGDGGTVAQVILPGSVLKIDPAEVMAGRKPLRGSNLYILVAGKLYADPVCLRPRALSLVKSALVALSYAHTRDNLIRVHTLAARTGMRFHLSAVPQDLNAGSDSMNFDPPVLRRLEEAGWQQATAGPLWRTTQPGALPEEQVLPRTGRDFLAPVPGPLMPAGECPGSRPLGASVPG